jgi:hypothetical protein
MRYGKDWATNLAGYDPRQTIGAVDARAMRNMIPEMTKRGMAVPADLTGSTSNDFWQDTATRLQGRGGNPGTGNREGIERLTASIEKQVALQQEGVALQKQLLAATTAGKDAGPKKPAAPIPAKGPPANGARP